MSTLPATQANREEPVQGSLEAAASRVDRVLEDLEHAPAAVRERALELKAALDEFHRLGLKRIVERLKSDAEGKRLLFALIDEPEVHALLAMHGLVRPGVAERVRLVLQRIRQYLEAEQVTAELVAVHERGVEIELRAKGSGCTSNLGALEHELEEVVLREVPEARAVQVRKQATEPRLVPLTSLLHGPQGGRVPPASVWHAGPREQDVTTSLAQDVDGRQLLFVRMSDAVYAFENLCPHQGLPLDRAMIDADARTITCPWHGYRFDCKTGECLTAPDAQLHTLPLRVVEGQIEVRLL
ncbi:Rieske (2Fe-2S) protein [Protofrankia symbiont of Coriaria ruscifolia]|uniref:Rieske (2Fe-2S) protein n=1 Tax=Protofrankia symbiont of Coriaria ruscifolia TaxID=1306542 RepID=UPI00104197FB|nr:Rieske (2Fe-2S) protein [Protofrankia symbiont of Coriaria ruscifolia]